VPIDSSSAADVPTWTIGVPAYGATFPPDE
jgi:hypothetical protein